MEAKAKAEAEQMAKKADAWKEYREAAMVDMVLDTMPKVRDFYSIFKICQCLSVIQAIQTLQTLSLLTFVVNYLCCRLQPRLRHRCPTARR